MYEQDQEGEGGLVDMVGGARKKRDKVSMVEVKEGMALMNVIKA